MRHHGLRLVDGNVGATTLEEFDGEGLPTRMLPERRTHDLRAAGESRFTDSRPARRLLTWPTKSPTYEVTRCGTAWANS
jgi:hypothetical protein